MVWETSNKSARLNVLRNSESDDPHFLLRLTSWAKW